MAQERRDLGLIVVDYLQLMDGNGGGNRNNEIEKLTRGLKRLAMKLHLRTYREKSELHP